MAVLIYGKDQCPYTAAAREDYAKRKVPFEYINVQADAAQLKEMLKHTKGARKVPVIVDGGRVTIGFNGT
jgi:glutaredoxin